MESSKLTFCPSCGKPVYFQGANNVAACACGKAWYRAGEVLTEVNMQPIHRSADVIQPGTTGSWKDIAFTVTGRLRVLFEDQAYNYWTLGCSDGFTRHLAEGYGMYTICEALPFNEAAIARKFRSDAQKLGLPDDRKFSVTARNESRVIEIEGNVFAPTLPDRMNSIEAASDAGRVELIAYSETVAVALDCHDIAPELLFLGNTREAEPEPRLFSCRNCADENHVLTYPYSQSWVCSKCGTRHSFTSGQYTTHCAQQDSDHEFSFDIGERIMLDDVDYQVIGLAHKNDADTRTDYWLEYTLYSRLHGFAFLTESAGHWSYLKETRQAPSPSEARLHRITFDNKPFRRYSKYHYSILYASGEFPGDVFSQHEETECMDYVAPPDILSIEKDARKRITWFRGKYVPRNVIAAQSTHALPRAVGMAPAQPSDIKVNTGTIAKSAVIAWIMAVLVQLLTGSAHTNRVVLDNNYYFSDSLNTQLFVSQKFELENASSQVELDFRSPLQNSWLELNATLVNAVSGTEYSADENVEFYSGYESGSHWTEGSQEGSIHFERIPAGTYFLQLTASRDANIYSKTQIFSAKLIYDPPTFRNMWIVMILLLIWPLVLGIMRYYSETTRWSNSQFANS